MIIGRARGDSDRGISKNFRTSTMLTVIALVFVMFGITITAFTQRESASPTRVHLCVKSNGQLRMIDNTASCDSSEQLLEWLVGGQVTDIRFGQGLIGTRDDGIVNLALDPAILQDCAGCGKIIAGFNDGPREMPGFVFGEELPQIATLDVPAGDYAIFAKLVVSAKDIGGPPVTRKESAICQLAAGSDFDNSSALLEAEDDRPTIESINDQTVLTLNVVHHFSEPAAVVLRCSKGPFAGEPPMEIRNIKIIAMEAASISNVFLGDN